jgi:hypothetical protein
MTEIDFDEIRFCAFNHAPTLPGLRTLHVDIPVRSAYRPATQLVHAEALKAPLIVLNFPTVHGMQSSAEVFPTSVRYLPALHSRHEAVPNKEAYCPAAQLVHAELPAREDWPRRQIWQSDSAVLPVLLRCLPAMHAAHTVL